MHVAPTPAQDPHLKWGKISDSLHRSSRINNGSVFRQTLSPWIINQESTELVADFLIHPDHAVSNRKGDQKLRSGQRRPGILQDDEYRFEEF